LETKFLYKQVYEGIKRKIEEGEYTKGGRLPLETDFCREYSVSPITVKKAMDILVVEGLVRRVPGKGTYVTEASLSNPEAYKEEDAKEPKSRENSGREQKKTIKVRESRKKIGLVLEHVASPFGLEMMYHLDREAEKAGYKLCIRFSYGSREKETDEIDYLLTLNVAGLIIMPCHGDHYNTAILKLIIENFPIVLIDKRMVGIPVSTVSTDGSKAVESLVGHLYERGSRRIGLITVDAAGTTSLIDRRDGFYRGLEKLDLPSMEECVLSHDNIDFFEDDAGKADVIRISEYFKKNSGKLDGLVCTEYGIMSPVVQAAGNLGIHIGKDIRVCCIDEDYQAANGYYFTHMKQDEKTISELALKTLLQGKNQPNVDYKVAAVFRQGKTT